MFVMIKKLAWSIFKSCDVILYKQLIYKCEQGLIFVYPLSFHHHGSIEDFNFKIDPKGRSNSNCQTHF